MRKKKQKRWSRRKKNAEAEEKITLKLKQSNLRRKLTLKFLKGRRKNNVEIKGRI